MKADAGSTTVCDGLAVSHYRLVHKIRSGGMSDVYLAEDTMLPRVVALKLLPADRSHDSMLQQRFMREARAASSLSHPNIARIYEAGSDDGRTFIAMEYIEGESLETRIAHGPLSMPEIVRIALQLVSAVTAAHKGGIVHRDLKPSNVMLTESGDVKVLDFGLAKFDDTDAASSDATAWKTESGLVLGTVPYMSPEQALGKRADQRSDVFSSGVVLYELVTGRLPFPGTTTTDTLFKIVNSQAEPMARFNYELPLELERIIRKCLEKSPDRRYQTAEDLLVDLRNFDRDQLGGGTPRLIRFRVSRGRLTVVAVLLLAVVAAVVMSRRSSRPADMPQNAEAYQLYVKARQQWNTRTKSGLYNALDLFRQTIEAEPTFAPAYAGLADTYSLLERYASAPNAETRTRAINAAEHAIELDADLPEAHASLASVRETYEWDWSGAEREYRTAIRLNPRDVTAHHWLALLLTRLGRFDEARREIAIAQQLDSTSPAIAAAVANIEYYGGDYDRSIAASRAALNANNDFTPARLQLVLSLLMSGNPTLATTELQPLAGKTPEAAVLGALVRARAGDTKSARAFLAAAEARPDAAANAYAIAAVHTACGDPADARRWLRVAVDMRSVWAGYLSVDPIFAPFRNDREFQQLLKTIGLPNHAR